MKRRITLSLLLTLTVLLSLVSLPATTQGQPRQSFRADSGVVRLGPNQILRITVTLGDTATHEVSVGFRVMHYPQGICSGGLCKYTVVSQDTSGPVQLLPGEAVSIDIDGHEMQHGVRGIVLSNSGDVQVTVIIIDATTGNVDCLNEIEIHPVTSM